MKAYLKLPLAILACFFTISSYCQLPNGSVAPDFTITDTDGVEHNLYDYLGQGYHVMLCFTATWSGPDWNYLTVNGAMNDMYETYGPEGTNEYIVLMLEADEITDLDDLNGTGGNTLGDFLSASNFPVADDGHNIFIDQYAGTYYPTIFSICPEGILNEVAQVSAEEVYAFGEDNCCQGDTPNDLSVESFSTGLYGDCTSEYLDVHVWNNGAETATSFELEVSQNGETETVYEWNGSLSSCEGEVITLQGLDLDIGPLEITINTPDDDLSNNTLEMDIGLNVFGTGTSHIRMELQTDSYPEENSWSIKDDEGNVLFLELGTDYEAQTPYLLDYYLPEIGCYEFAFEDVYGDGLNSEYVLGDPNGSLHVYFVNDDGTAGESIIDLEPTLWFEELTTFMQVEEVVPVIVSGNVYHDLNENGQQDGEESGIPGIEVHLDDQITITGENGVYSFIYEEGAQNLSIVYDEEVWPNNTTPSSYDVEELDAFSFAFGLSNNDPYYNGLIHYAQSGVFVCEQEICLYAGFTNDGNTVADAEFTFELDPMFTYQFAWPAPTEENGQSITWSIEDIPAGATEYFHLYVIAPDWESMGEMLSNSLTLNLYDSDGGLQDTEVLTEEDELLCSYDPNDKQVFPEGATEMHYVSSGTQLEYFVRFQNTGNYYATDVTVTDPISEHLDLSTFELVHTSHYCIPTVDLENNSIDFYFPNIMLPDSTTDEPGSHGSITFLIDHVEGIPQPTAINNTAYIYFDSNPAVVTNTTLTTIDDLNSVFELNETLSMKLSPNPTNGILKVEANNGWNNSTLRVIDPLGKIVLSKNDHFSTSVLDLSFLENGIYLIEWRSANNELLSSSRFIKE